VDAGYALDTGYLAPFKNTRYHLDDFRGVDMDTLSRQEKFNFTHSSLRNVVERSFGVLKARWHILNGVPFCHREKQKMITMSCFALHNFYAIVRLELVRLHTHRRIGFRSMLIPLCH